MVRTNPDGCTEALTHGCTHIHRTKIVTTMSHLPAIGLDKNLHCDSSFELSWICIYGKKKENYSCYPFLSGALEVEIHMLVWIKLEVFIMINMIKYFTPAMTCFPLPLPSFAPSMIPGRSSSCKNRKYCQLSISQSQNLFQTTDISK